MVVADFGLRAVDSPRPLTDPPEGAFPAGGFG